jgi:hypothetical protein
MPSAPGDRSLGLALPREAVAQVRGIALSLLVPPTEPSKAKQCSASQADSLPSADSASRPWLLSRTTAGTYATASRGRERVAHRVRGSPSGRRARASEVQVQTPAPVRAKQERRGAPAWRCSESQPGAGRHHRRAARAHGVDDLLGVDSLQVDRGRAEVGVPELALDDVERNALPG